MDDKHKAPDEELMEDLENKGAVDDEYTGAERGILSEMG